jgi:hypothetical protein
MKSASVIFFFLLILLMNNLYSVEITGGSIEEFNKQIEELKKRNPGMSFNLDRKEVVEDKKECSHCPSYLNLTKQVNNILAKVSASGTEEVPREINKLKMLFYTIKSRDLDGNLKCQNYEMIDYMMNDDKKLKGEAKFIASEFFEVKGIESLFYNMPENEKIVYYFKDQEKSNVLVQVVVEKNKKPEIRYYSYTPSSKEVNPYNLPDLDRKADGLSGTGLKLPVETTLATSLADPNKERLGFNFDPKWIKKGALPRDYYLGEAFVTSEVIEGVMVKGLSRLSIAKGSEAEIKIGDKEKDVVHINLKTKLNGNTDHEITVPYDFKLDSLGENTKIRGALKEETHATGVSLSLVGGYQEVLSAVLKENKDTGRTSLVLTKNVAISPSENISFSGGRDEMASNFVAMKHAKSLNKTTSMVVDVKLDSERKLTLYYTLSSRF